ICVACRDAVAEALEDRGERELRARRTRLQIKDATHSGCGLVNSAQAHQERSMNEMNLGIERFLGRLFCELQRNFRLARVGVTADLDEARRRTRYPAHERDRMAVVPTVEGDLRLGNCFLG